MADRTLGMMIANVARKVGSGPAIPRLEIMQALNTAHMEIHGAYDWPWAYKETNISIAPSYSTGTVSVNIGSTTVTGTTTVWNTLWANRRIRLAGGSDWAIASIGGAGTLTLSQPFYGAANLTDEDYVIYQDVYQMPADFEPGKDLVLCQNSSKERVRHVPRMTAESGDVSFDGKVYADYGRDSTGRHLIKIIPEPTDTDVLRLVYKARPADFAAIADTSWLPQTYQDILELVAEAEVKRIHGIPGWDVPAAIAARKRLQLKRQVVAMPIDNRSDEFTSGPQDGPSAWWRYTSGA